MSKKEPWEWVCDYCGTSGTTRTKDLGWLALALHVKMRHPQADPSAHGRNGIVHKTG